MPEIQAIKITRRNCFSRFNFYGIKFIRFFNDDINLMACIVPPKEEGLFVLHRESLLQGTDQEIHVDLQWQIVLCLDFRDLRKAYPQKHVLPGLFCPIDAAQ